MKVIYLSLKRVRIQSHQNITISILNMITKILIETLTVFTYKIMIFQTKKYNLSKHFILIFQVLYQNK